MRTETCLDEPDADEGLITWLDVEAVDDRDDLEVAAGRASVAIIHVAVAEGELLDGLDADSGELCELFDVFFDQGGLREGLAEGFGHDVLYVRGMEIEAPYATRNLDFAIVRRLADTVGQGCELVVMRSESPEHCRRWEQIGFRRTRPANDAGWMHLHMAYLQPRVVDSEGTFHAVAAPAGPSRKLH